MKIKKKKEDGRCGFFKNIMYNASYSPVERKRGWTTMLLSSFLIFLTMEAELMSKPNPALSSRIPSVMMSNLYKGKLILIVFVL